jgi:arsenate reductase (glutaredoxin)
MRRHVAVDREALRLAVGLTWPVDPDDKPDVVRHMAEGMTTIYGIKNCETMKKARAWLDKHKVAYTFHDYKASGLDEVTLEGWVRKVGWETLLNRAGTTFRRLPDADKEGLTETKAIALMLAQPSVIKRPVLDKGGKLAVGFKPEQYEKIFPKR